MTVTVEERLAALESRLAHLEDLAAIQRLVAQYGPAADSNALEQAAGTWTGDGVYEILPGGPEPDSVARLTGRAEIVAMLAGPGHQAQVQAGCAHLATAPLITVEGDRAVALCYLQLVVHRDGGFGVARQSANRWDLERGADGWRVVRRTTRLLDGRPQSGELFADALREFEAAGSLYGTGAGTQRSSSPPST